MLGIIPRKHQQGITMVDNWKLERKKAAHKGCWSVSVDSKLVTVSLENFQVSLQLLESIISLIDLSFSQTAGLFFVFSIISEKCAANFLESQKKAPIYKGNCPILNTSVSCRLSGQISRNWGRRFLSQGHFPK